MTIIGRRKPIRAVGDASQCGLEIRFEADGGVDASLGVPA